MWYNLELTPITKYIMDKNIQNDMLLKQWVMDRIKESTIFIGPNRQSVLDYILGQTSQVSVKPSYLTELVNTAFNFIWSLQIKNDSVRSIRFPNMTIPGLDHMHKNEYMQVQDIIFGAINYPERYFAYLNYSGFNEIYPKNKFGQYRLKFIVIDSRTAKWEEVHLVSDDLYQIDIIGFYIVSVYKSQKISGTDYGLIYKSPTDENWFEKIVKHLGFTKVHYLSNPDDAEFIQ